jgi:MFS family permease
VAVVSVLSASGPLLGGGLAQVGSWRAVLALPVVALALGVPIARLAPAKPTARGRLDIRGALLVAVTMTGLVVLLQVPALQPPAPVLAVVACLALVGGAGLFWHVGRRPHGLLPIRVLTDRTVMLSAVTGWALLASYIGMLLALPLLLAAERGWSPLQIGLALLPAAAVGAVASRLTSPLEMRFGIRRVATGFACLSLVGVVTAAAAPGLPVVLVAGMGMVVAGFAGGQAVLLDAVTSAVDEQVRGAALGVFNLVFFTGGAFGAAAVGGVADLLGLPAALGVLAAAPLIGVLMASRLPVVAPGAGPDIPTVEHPSLPTS